MYHKMRGCSCGRSPTGLCIGWHRLSKEEYEKKKKKYEELSEEEKKDNKDFVNDVLRGGQ